MAPPAPITVAILSYNRADEVLRTVERTRSLPEQPQVIVVDNGSTDGSAARIAGRFPDVRVIALERNRGAAARNEALQAAATPYVACSDDDTHWAPGSLARAAELLDRHPRVGVLTARVLVGPEQREDPSCTLMAASPLPCDGLPGKALIGFLAGACVFRRRAFLDVGGYDPRLFIGGEEALLALDLATRGWASVYASALTVYHEPSRVRDSRLRRRLLLRNALWVAWLRRPIGTAFARSLRLLRDTDDVASAVVATLDALRGLPWVLRNRQVLPAHIEAMCTRVE